MPSRLVQQSADTIGRVARSPHHETRGDPLPAHRRFLTEPSRHLNLSLVSFLAPFQLLPVPASPLELLTQDLLGALLGAFPPLASTIMPAQLPIHLGQQLTPKLLIAQIP